MKTLLLVAALLVSPAALGDAGVVAAPVAAVDAGMAAAPAANPVVLPTPTVNAPDQAVDMNFVVTTALSIKQAATSGDWGHLVFLLITALVMVTRKVLAPRFKILQNQLTPTILSFAWAAAGALASVWPAGKHLTAVDVLLAVQAGLMGAGGFHIIEAVLKHFSPVDPTQKNWATMLNGLLISFEPIVEKALPTVPPPPKAPGA